MKKFWKAVGEWLTGILSARCTNCGHNSFDDDDMRCSNCGKPW